MDIETLEQQVQALRTRQNGAVKALIDAHADTLLSAAFGLGFSEADAEELVQDTFVTFLDALDRFEGRSQVRTYLFGIFYNKASNLRKQSQREAADEEIESIFDRRFDAKGMWIKPPAEPDAEAVNREISHWIERCSDGLSAQQRTAFYLKSVDGEGTESICKILNVSATHLGVLLYRARLKLRECLEKKWGKLE
jgi:RNA polymerase sigma-70 factor (ECF subfamily)